MSGRRRAQVAEDARLLGQRSFIFEAGACVVLDGEEHWLTGELLPGELTIAEQIERSGAPALLLERLSRAPRVPRAVAPRTRSLAPVPRPRRRDRGRRAARRARARRPAARRQRRRQPPLGRARRAASTCAATTSCRRRLRRRRPSRCTARCAATRARRRFAVGDSREDLACASTSAPSGWSPTRSSATRRCASWPASSANVRVAEAGHGAGVYEAVVSTLMDAGA